MLGLAKYAHGCTTGVKIMGVRNHFLVGFKECFTGGNACRSGQEAMIRELTDPRDETTTIILLNGHNIKLPSAFVSRSQTSLEKFPCAVNIGYWRSLELVKVQRISISGMLNHKWDCLWLTLNLKNHCRRRNRKIVRATCQRVPERNSVLWTC